MSEEVIGKILIVDDKPANLFLLVEMLSKHRHEIFVARSGEEAIRIFQKNQIDIILLDVMMADIDGFETCTIIKKSPENADVPVIFISALNDSRSKIRGFSVGGVDFISKPFQEEEVIARIKTHLSLSFTRKRLNSTLRELKQSEEMFRYPVENSPVGIFVYHDGRFRYVNKRLASMLEYKMEELQDTPVDSVLLSGIVNLLNDASYQGISPVFSMNKEIQGRRSDGQILDLELYLSMMQNEGKRLIYGTIIDITEKKRLDAARLQSERKYRLITENMQNVVWTLDVTTWRFTYISPSISDLLGYHDNEEKSALKLLPFSDEVISFFSEKVREKLTSFLANSQEKEIFSITHEQEREDGTMITIESSANFFIREDTGTIELLGISRDISEKRRNELEIERKNRELSEKNENLSILNEELISIEEDRKSAYEELKQHQLELKKSENALNKAHAIAKLGLWEWDISANEVYASDGFNRLLGFVGDDQIPTYHDLYQQILSEYRDEFDNSINNLIKKGTPFTIDCWITWNDRSLHAIRILGDGDFDESGTIRMINLIFQDVTSQKLLEEEIIEASREKETLLREIHHRVKNNMQIITSLLSMQSRMIHEPTVVALFKETQNRVRSLALVHELLYQSEKLNKINYQDYLQKVTSYLFDSYRLSPERISCSIMTHNVELPVDTAVPCSLVITELITNSIKYAFNDGRKGEISIDLSYNSDTKRYLLDYRDNGIGFPSDYHPDNETGFGSSLISGLTRQMSGNLSVESSNEGIHYVIIFPG